MAKRYIANTALILNDEAGHPYRVGHGEQVSLTAEQYEALAAHVVPAGGQEEDAAASLPEAGPAESGTEAAAETAAAPKKSAAKK